MSTRQAICLSALRDRLLSTLKRVRAGRSNDDVNAEFYIALGLIGAAVTLDAISIDASDRLHDLALNASEQRAAELTAIGRAGRQAAIPGAAA
ncbi:MULTISPECIES: hypothetical protein [unclassified Pseudomonas]|uniref:hypothetical protein n=1 Tax=unclassified Pseudomonas TaxID=196821 RepID=UPI00244B4F66|nr:MULTISPECIES: hypothetical protein [unclassified Pseudomonas]MDG9926141.1 hypothetical protein [Pseudomonas sp. GD04045]MDH0037485.1 hypothetical protein [Pseudomonas sp. GD04019]